MAENTNEQLVLFLSRPLVKNAKIIYYPNHIKNAF